MLNALTEFQKNRKIELLEWRPGERTLYILEPAFLFYLRGRQQRELSSAPTRENEFMIEVRELLSELRVLTLQATKSVITSRGLLAIENKREKPKQRSE